MKKIVLLSTLVAIIAVAATIMAVNAGEPQEGTAPMADIYNAMPNAIIHQDSTITQLMEDHWNGTVRGEIEVEGWRVQVYSSNNQLQAKLEAETLKEQLEKELTEPIYIDFLQPFWKVRIGNFRTVEDARAYRDTLIQQFPELQAESYPVKDMITIKK